MASLASKLSITSFRLPLNWTEVAREGSNMSYQRLVEDLSEKVLRQLSIHLNPPMVLGGDWKSMAGEFGMKMMEIMNYDRLENPTLAVLTQWWRAGSGRTVTELISVLKKIKRFDAVRLLTPHEFYDIETDSNAEVDEKVVNIAEENSDLPPPEYAPSRATPNNLVFPNNNIAEVSRDEAENSLSRSQSTASENGPSDREYAPSRATPNNLVFPNNNMAEVSRDEEENSLSRSQSIASENGPSDRGHTSTGSQCTYENGLLERVMVIPVIDTGSTPMDGEIVMPVDGASRASQDKGYLRNRRNKRNEIKVSKSSVQTQMPSPTAQIELPIFPPPSNDNVQNNVKLIAPHDKIALVIGNQNYDKAEYNKLSYSLNDAHDIGEALSELGFKVINLADLSLTDMRTAMLAFCRLLGPGIYAVFYFAGHGYELEGENYLLPVDAKSEDPNGCIRAQEFLQEMQSCDTLLNVMFLDCCRTRMEAAEKPKCSLQRKAKGNTIIAYSCLAQHKSFELPDQKNGLYARHLLNHIHRDTRIECILMDVSSAVVASQAVEQRPIFESDAYLECRLTAKIIVEDDGLPWKERVGLWKEGTRLPDPMNIQLDNYDINLKFLQDFSNIMIVVVSASSKSNQDIENLQFMVNVFEPLEVVLDVRPVTLHPNDVDVFLGKFGIVKLQKLVYENLFLTIEFESNCEKVIKKIDFGTPLISGITSKFHEWIMNRKHETQSGAMSSWL